MKLVELKCKNCGATLKVDPESEEITCKYCQTTFKLDDEVKHVKFDDMEQNGYEFEKGRIRAQQESKTNQSATINYSQPQKKNNKMLWLVLAWIFLLPFTATFFIIKSDKLDKKKKIIFIAIIWVVFLVIGITGSIQDKKELKNKIIECYSEETYNQLDKIFGIDNIRSNLSDYTTCDNLKLKDKNYKEITIKLDDDKKLIYIRVDNDYKYGVEVENSNNKNNEANETKENNQTKEENNVESEYIESDKYMDYLDEKITKILNKKETIFKSYQTGTLGNEVYELYVYADKYYNYNDYKKDSINITKEIISSIKEKKYKKVLLYPKTVTIQIKYCGYGKDLNSGKLQNSVFPLGVFSIQSNELNDEINYEEKVDINNIWF